MKARIGMAVTIVVVLFGSAYARELDMASKQFFIEKNGGGMEARVKNPKDTQARDALRQELQQAARDQSVFSSPALQQYQRDLTYRYQKTDRGGRIRVTTKNRDALRIMQDFLLSQMSDRRSKAVSFTFIQDTSLVVVPVMVNDHGPYKFLLDTGASNSILSPLVADALQIPPGRSDTLLSAGGNVPVTVRTLEVLQVGQARLRQIQIAVANFSLLQTLRVDGILGGDYLRRFKVSIDYDNHIVQIEPSSPDSPESMSMLVA